MARMTAVPASSPATWAPGAMLILVGLVQGAGFGVVVAREHRVATAYRATECTVLSTRPPHGKESAPLFADVTVDVGGQDISSNGLPVSDAAVAATLAPGQRVPCWYDPERPGSSARLDQRVSPLLFWLGICLMPAGLIGFGIRKVVRSVRRARHLAS
jgi:hypothetical protein